MKTFDEWIDEYMPNRLHDSHATFTLNDMKEAFNGGQENLNETIKKVLSFDRTELEDLIEAVNRYSDFPLVFQDMERQKEENKRMERMKSIRGKMKFMLNRLKEDEE